MVKKKEKEEVSMELKFCERDEMGAIQNSREALQELQRAVIPFAEAIAKRQRIWWNRVLEDRGLTREGTQYTIENNRTIVDTLLETTSKHS